MLNKTIRSKLEIAKELFKQICFVDISNVDKVSRNATIAQTILKSYSRNICTVAKKKTIFY